MTPSPACFNLIKRSEGLRLKAYKCPAGIWTIGYGSTHGVFAGQTITFDEAEKRLHDDVAYAADEVARLAHDYTQGQFDALVDLVFNLGSTKLAGSTLLRMHNRGNYIGAARQFPLWVHAGLKVLPGLVQRRAADVHLYLTGALPGDVQDVT